MDKTRVNRILCCLGLGKTARILWRELIEEITGESLTIPAPDPDREALEKLREKHNQRYKSPEDWWEHFAQDLMVWKKGE